MLRLRLENGEETVLRSVDELALAIRSRSVTPFAKADRGGAWAPLRDLPEYQQAMALLPTLPPEPGDDPLLTGTAAELRGGINVYQMVSRSAVELEARRRPQRIYRAVTVFGGLFVAGVVFLAARHSPSEASLAHPIAAKVVGGLPAVPAAPAPARAGKTPSPLALTNAWIVAVRVIDDNLATAARLAGVRELIHPAALASSDSLLDRLAALKAYRHLITEAREKYAAATTAYRDTARGLVDARAWSQAELSTWRLHGPAEETARTAARVDSLLAGLEELYSLLLEERGRYRLTARGASFQGQELSLRFERLRRSLEIQAAPPAPASEPVQGPLTVLLIAMAGRSLPPLIAP